MVCFLSLGNLKFVARDNQHMLHICMELITDLWDRPVSRQRHYILLYLTGSKCENRMTLFRKGKLKKSVDQTNIDEYRVAANTTYQELTYWVWNLYDNSKMSELIIEKRFKFWHTDVLVLII